MANDPKAPNSFDALSNPIPKPKPGVKLTITSLDTNAKEAMEKRKKRVKQTIKRLDDIESAVVDTVRSESELEKHGEMILKKLKKLQEQEDRNEVELDKEFKNFDKKEDNDYEPTSIIKDTRKEIQDETDEQLVTQANIEKQIISKSKEFEKQAKTTSTFFNDTWKNIIETGTDIYSDSKKMKKETGNESFCSKFSKTVGKVFSSAAKNGSGNILKYYLEKSIVVRGIIKFASFAKDMIVKLYDGMVALAKIGWKVVGSVFNIITTPFLSVGKFFANVLGDFLSSPLGLLTAVAGFVAVSYFLWEPVLDIVKTVAKAAWNWILGSVDKIFGEGTTSAIGTFFTTQYEKISGFFSGIWNFFTDGDQLPKFWDAHFSKIVGIDSFKISEWFQNKLQIIQDAWHTFSNAFLVIKNQNLIDELYVLYSTIRAIVLGKDNIRPTNLMEENNLRAKTALKQQLERQAEAYIQGEVASVLFKKYGGIATPEIKDELLKVGHTAFANFIKTRKFTRNDELNTETLSKLTVDVDSITSGLFGIDPEKLKKIQESSSAVVQATSQSSYELAKILTDPRLKMAEFSSELANTLDITIKNMNGLYNSVAREQQQKNNVLTASKHLNQSTINILTTLIEDDIRKGSLNTVKSKQNKYIDTEKLINAGVSERFNLYIDIAHKSRAEGLNSLKTFIMDHKLNEQLNASDAKSFINDILTKENTSLLTNDEFTSLHLYDSPIKQAHGGVVTGQIHALIGEAGYPEVVIPLNQEGLEFVYNSMKDFIVDNSSETYDVKTNAKKNIIKRFKTGGGQQADYTMFDMKNLSRGIIGVD